MKAMVLAAGRGSRMRPLSDQVPKPLLPAGRKPLIQWQIEALARGGIQQIVINLAHHGDALRAALADGHTLNVQIVYSEEGPLAADALETAGGIIRALPLLGDAPFIVISGDIVTDFPYASLSAPAGRIAAGHIDGHVVMVDNPDYHPRGDFGIADQCATRVAAAAALTYGNIAVLSPRLFAGLPVQRLKLFPWLYSAIDAGRIGAQHYRGRWANIGTPDDLHRIDMALRAEPWTEPQSQRQHLS